MINTLVLTSDVLNLESGTSLFKVDYLVIRRILVILSCLEYKIVTADAPLSRPI